MTHAPPTQREKAERFRALHLGGDIVVLPCAWDVASAKMFEREGFLAIGTSSAGIAAAHGYADGQKLGFAEHLEVIRAILRATSVPVSADLEAGYATTVDGVAANVGAALKAGIVGVNIEDEDHARTGGRLMEPVSHMVAKIAAVRALAAAQNIPLFVNAKVDAIWLSTGAAPQAIFNEAVLRANAYGAAGADCIFIPGDFDRNAIARLVGAIAYPLNLVIKDATPPLGDLRPFAVAQPGGPGIARLSMGSGPMRAAMGLTRRIAKEVKSSGTYRTMLDIAVPYGEVVALFST